MKTIIHKATERGHANHGWLDTRHSFSFAGYYNPERMHFGMLRVLNDDVVQGGKGFGTHPHENMEIISIPLSGELEHKDSTGSGGVIKKNDVQIMSAGTGVYHSEFNKNASEPVNFLQLWIFPKYKDITPRYDQKRFDPKDRLNQFQEIVSPLESSGKGVKINQDAYLHWTDMTEAKEMTYEVKIDGNGTFIFVLEGDVKVGEYQLERRDAIGLSETNSIDFKTNQGAELLIIEVPMN
jgi:redox-sensitive bicupin YhaK (pirin superfamily)